jgi:hypothetical protein
VETPWDREDIQQNKGICGSKASGKQHSKVWDPGGLQRIEDS